MTRPVRTAENTDPVDPPLASVWSDRNRADARIALIRRCILWVCVGLVMILWAYAAVIAAGAGLMEGTPL